MWSSQIPVKPATNCFCECLGVSKVLMFSDRILWRRPGHDEDELVELLPPSDGMCQIAAVDGVHVVNPEEITWNRAMPKRCD